MNKDKSIFQTLIHTYQHIPSTAREVNFESLDANAAEPGDYIHGKAWLSTCIYIKTPESYTPYRPLFKGHAESQGVSGISWLLNYMPVSKIDITHMNSKLAFLYPYKSPGFNIKLSFQGTPIENYSSYMSLMYSKENYPMDSFLMEDDCFKPFPVLVPEYMDTETIVDFRGTLHCFGMDPSEVMSKLDPTAKANYSLFLKEGSKPLCINTCADDTYIRTEKFKDFKNSRYNVKYGSIIKEFKFEADAAMPGFIPDIPHAVCGNIGEINEEFKSPAFSSTPNYGIKKAKAISSCCGPILFNYVSGNIVSISVHYNFSDKIQKQKFEKSMIEFEVLLKDQLKNYMKEFFKLDINFSEI